MRYSWICLLVLSTEVSGQTLSGSGIPYAVLNRPFQFICTGDVTTTTLAFNRDGTTLCTIIYPSDHARCAEFISSPGYLCSCGSTGVFYMNISEVSLQDGDRWKCGTGDFINLPVYYDPSIDKSRFPSNVTSVKGRQLYINCATYTTPGRPSSTSYTWTYPDGSSTSGSTLHVNSVDTSDAGQYTCIASNNFSSSQQGQDSATLQLTVQFAPTVSGGNDSYPVTEFSPLNIDCRTYTTAGNPPSTSYRWTGPNSFSSSQPILSIRSINRNQAGTYTCRAANTLTPTGGSTESGIEEGQFSVDVQFLDRPILTIFQSEVSENESVRIKCETLSQPTALLTVRNVDNDTVVVEEETNELTYTIPRAQCLHNGSFVCSGENKVAGVLYSMMVPLNVLCSPRLDTSKPSERNISSGLNDVASLLLNVISNPAPTFTWYLSNNKQLVPIPNVTKHEVISTVTYSVLQIHVTDVRDYASFVVEAANNYGRLSTRFNLLQKSSTSRDVPSDRLGMGVGIGIASVLPIVIGVLVYVWCGRRNLPRQKSVDANQETQIDMTSAHHNVSDNRRTYSELTATPGNEYEELKVVRSEESPIVYQNASIEQTRNPD